MSSNLSGVSPVPAEATLIRLVRLAAGMSVAEAAAVAGISKARWSQVENGHETRLGTRHAVIASDGLLARMADAVGADADRLAGSGRRDAAAVLREIHRRRLSAVPSAAPRYSSPSLQRIADDPDLDDETKQAMIALAERMRAAREDDERGTS